MQEVSERSGVIILIGGLGPWLTIFCCCLQEKQAGTELGQAQIKLGLGLTLIKIWISLLVQIKKHDYN